ncbi:YetF domain-containing protein [Bacillus sp. NTK074B]|uniref:YetF domain-containing protein n=1 Tax=Bacillus sp. NTK074B TaxID=2802174 RepID=UPI0034A0B488
MLPREKNIFSISEVASAIFGTDGKLTLRIKPGPRPLTKRDQNVFTGHPNYIPSEGIVSLTTSS